MVTVQKSSYTRRNAELTILALGQQDNYLGAAMFRFVYRLPSYEAYKLFTEGKPSGTSSLGGVTGLFFIAEDSHPTGKAGEFAIQTKTVNSNGVEATVRFILSKANPVWSNMDGRYGYGSVYQAPGGADPGLVRPREKGGDHDVFGLSSFDTPNVRYTSPQLVDSIMTQINAVTAKGQTITISLPPEAALLVFPNSPHPRP